MKMQTESDITREIEEAIREITEPKNRMAQWWSDNFLAVIGYIMIFGGLLWLFLINREISQFVKETLQSASELAPSPDVAQTNIDKIGLLLALLGVKLSMVGVETTVAWGIVGFGASLVGVGIAVYVHHSSVRTGQLITVGLEATGQIILRAVANSHWDTGSKEAEENTIPPTKAENGGNR